MNENMNGKVAVIRGATSGIGQVASEKLAGMGARVVQVARDRERGEAALKRLQECAPGAAHTIHYAELSRLNQMKRVASEIASAEPRIAMDAKGFIKTGTDLSHDDSARAHWPLARAPHLLETSLPDVFAVGDVRGGSLKRAASAVGEGSIAIAFVHQVLHE